jgi:uncharacterized protein
MSATEGRLSMGDHIMSHHASPLTTPSETSELILQTEALVRERLSGEATGHDWFHTDRVRRMALRLADEEETTGDSLDRRVIELAALLHDLEDWKFHGGDDQVGVNAARHWLQTHGVDQVTTDHVAEIIGTMSFKGAGVATPMRTREGAIVQDADRLDAIGAIGIARAFAYGGHKGSMLHDPDLEPWFHESFDDYKARPGTTINHFSEKLLLLRDRMNTDAARRIAEERHRVMEAFLHRFLAEWRGLD